MLYSSANIPYQEYRAISELMNAHPQALNGSLRALIAFGEIVATGESEDINLLEIVDDWQGPRFISYGSTAALPLRGRLNLYFLTPEEFEHPDRDRPAGQTWSSADLLTRVRWAYAILLEEPNDYAYRIMARLEELPSPEAEDESDSALDPIAFLQRQATQKVPV